MSEPKRFNDARLEEIVEQYYLGDIIQLPEEEIKTLFAEAEIKEGVSRTIYDALGIHQFHISEGEVCYNPFLEDDSDILWGCINRLRKEKLLRQRLVKSSRLERDELIKRINKLHILFIIWTLPYSIWGSYLIGHFLGTLLGA
jgi:hypothetical protein